MSRERILETARLALTPWRADDIDDLLTVHADPQTMRFVRRGRAETRAETARLLEQYMAEDAELGFTKWRLTDPDDRLVGRAGFGRHEDGRELGYTVRRELWGRGLATEFAHALVTWHLTHAAGCPLYAHVAVGNPASRRVLEKVGFDHVGTADRADVPYDLFRLPQSRSKTAGS